MNTLHRATLPALTGLAALLSATTAAAADGIPCDGCIVEKFASCGGFLEGLAVAQDGALWVLDLTGDRILTVDDAGTCTERGKTGGLPNGAKFHPDGRLLITGSQGLLAFDPSTGAISVLADSFQGEALTGLNDLVLDGEGGVYFTAPSGSSLLDRTGRVFYLPDGAAEPTLLADGIAYPNGIALAPDGRAVLVAEFAAKRILSIPSADPGPGIALSYVYANTAGGVGADGIAVDGEGRLFAAIFGASEVQVYGADGLQLGAIALPDEAGAFTTNLVERDGQLYITEAQRGEIWRVSLTAP